MLMSHFATFFSYAASALAISAATQASTPSMEAISSCFDQQSALEPFRGAVIVSDGHRSFEKTVGFRDALGNDPITLDTPFHLASVQKVLTRVAVGRLVDVGKVKLDAPVANYVKGLPPAIGAVTVDQLLQHRSGVTSLTMIGPQYTQVLKSARTAKDLLPLIASQPLEFQPGTKEVYSNGGYFLLGALIEEVTGTSYADFLKREIFSPLNMGNSGLERTKTTATPMTRMPPIPGPPLTMARAVTEGPLMKPSSAGNGVSSAKDLLKLGFALLGDDLLSRDTKSRIFPRRGDIWRVGQAGGTMGVNTDFAVYPEQGLVAVTLTNADPPSGELMAQVLRDVALGKGCKPIAAKDRPSPFGLMRPSPAPSATTS